MKSLIVAALLIGSAATTGAHALHAKAPKLEALHSYTFDAYAEDFSKTYATAEERAVRAKYFADTLAMIKAHNANPDKLYEMNVNHMADWSVAERKALMGTIPANRRNLNPFLKTIQTSSETPKLQIPEAVDWRNKSVVTPPKNQGSCGSCWAFAATETMESHWAIATGQLIELSTQQVTSCTPNPRQCGGSGGCQGATENLAFEYAISAGGVVAASDFPYNGRDGNCGSLPPSAPRVAKFSAIYKVKENDQEDMLQTVATKGPVTIGVWADPMMFYSRGVFNGCSYDRNMNINHAVQLVGYGSEKGTDYWIVRNSWGASWGEGGYIRLLREKEPKCGMDSTPHDGSACKDDPNTPVKVCGQCGILSESSFAIPQV